MAKTNLVSIAVPSIYKVKDVYVDMPSRMAKCTPDFKKAILSIQSDVLDAGATFRLSDLFRTAEDQLKAHQDYTSGRKKAYSPPPGSSFHEAGRAMDISLEDIRPLGGNFLEKFWVIAAKYKVVPIITTPNSRLSEAWHFECRGEFDKVVKKKGYKEGVKAAILDIGVDVASIKDDEMAWIQGALIAYGIDVGEIDGLLGPKTKAAIKQVKKAYKWSPTSARSDAEWELPDQWLKDTLSQINGASR